VELPPFDPFADSVDGQHLYYDRAGNPIKFWDWAAKMEMGFDRIVEQTVLVEGENAVTVSTIWIGLDMNWLRGPPMIFETMVFGGPTDLEGRRYSTEEEARAGHAQMVEETTLMLRLAEDPQWPMK
jgi:hypothetical protein